jgi:hypothetical protein
MSRSKVVVAVVVGLGALSAPAAAAASSNSPAWPYVVTRAVGSVAWQYNAPGGGGTDSMRFQGRPRANGVLTGWATYTDQNSQGCGPVTRTKNQNYGGPSFSVQGDYVVVTWNLPLPNQSLCQGATVGSIAQQLHGKWFSTKLPLAHTTCEALSVTMGGHETLSQGGMTGTLSYKTTLTLTRLPTTITVSL